MKKQLLLNLTILLFTVGIFAQSSGTFSGTFTSSTGSVTHTFNSTGNGQYIFTGSYTSSGSVTSTAFIGTLNDYNIGGNYETDNNLGFNSDCVETNQTIGIYLMGVGGGTYNYTINYQFVPTTYSATDTEPNDTFAQAINTTENTNYEGWFNSGSQNPTSNIDDTDWYKFTSPRNGELKITIKDGDEFGGEASPSLFSSNNLSQEIFSSSLEQNGLTTTYTFNEFNFNGQEFGIRLQSSCVSYQLSWTVDDSSLNIENYNLDNSIKLYPNPVSDNLSVTINNNLNIEKLEIIGITGKLIKQTNLKKNSIPTQDLKNGIYFVKIYSDKGITTKKIIKSK